MTDRQAGTPADGHVIDAAAVFECQRVGHEPSMRFTPNVFVASWICPCARCGRDAEFKNPEPIRVR